MTEVWEAVWLGKVIVSVLIRVFKLSVSDSGVRKQAWEVTDEM